jgi:hypothetical protein
MEGAHKVPITFLLMKVSAHSYAVKIKIYNSAF